MHFEKILAIFLIITGLACLAMSGTFLSGFNIERYIETLIQLCIWMGIPVVFSGIIYFILIKRKKGDSK